MKFKMERTGTLECSVTGQPAKLTSCDWLLKQRCFVLDLIHFRWNPKRELDIIR